MDGSTPPMPPAPSLPPTPAPTPPSETMPPTVGNHDVHRKPSSGGGSTGNGADQLDSLQSELEAEHSRLQELIIVFFAALCGIALLVFVLTELQNRDEYAPVVDGP